MLEDVVITEPSKNRSQSTFRKEVNMALECKECLVKSMCNQPCEDFLSKIGANRKIDGRYPFKVKREDIKDFPNSIYEITKQIEDEWDEIDMSIEFEDEQFQIWIHDWTINTDW
jgi:hypothetical protein